MHEFFFSVLFLMENAFMNALNLIFLKNAY